MQRSANTLADGAVIEADAIVVGSGPLGIITALELADAGHRVALIESGDDGIDDGAQQLGVANSQDKFQVDKLEAVRRAIGGTSAMWGGRCLPFDPIDFEARPAVPEELWPISYAELEPYFAASGRWFVSGRPIFNARDLPEIASKDMIPGLPDGDVRTTDLERWSLPTRFGAIYGERLAAHPKIDLITNLTCTEIIQDDSGSVDHLVLRTLDGKTLSGRARQYVLAAGGLETTRLLLASQGHTPGGIGSESGHLGKYYMGHVEARVGELHLSTPPESTIYSHERDADGVYVRRRFTFSADFQRREAIPNAAIWIVNPSVADHRHGSGILSGVYLTLISPIGGKLLAEGIRRAQTKALRPTTIRAHLGNIVRDLVPAIKFAFSFSYARFLRRGRKAPGFFIRSASNVYPLHYHGEHRPHAGSTVTLSDERDALGVPRLDVKMHFSDEDIASVARAMDEIDKHVRTHGVGHVEYLYDDIEQAVCNYIVEFSGYHQVGTTRMSATPEGGVVSADLAVHGTPNLAIASTSVLPTSGQANPTYTGGALAVRLAERLHRELTSSADETRRAGPA